MRAFPARQNSSLPLPWRMFLLATLVMLLLVVSADGIAGQTTDDHGDTPATATSVSLGSSIAGRIDPGDYVDINVEPAWDDDVLGEGVNIAVVDRGMDVGHEDLKDNVDIGLNHDYNDEGNIYNRYQHHGTHVAGIIAARDNSVGVRGVAPRAPYSEMGANLWVCAPSNERPGIFGLGGRFGIVSIENSDNYVRDFEGTSAAAPIVSGVAALMRSVNPDLTWRDLG